jgi:hypothetical protein
VDLILPRARSEGRVLRAKLLIAIDLPDCLALIEHFWGRLDALIIVPVCLTAQRMPNIPLSNALYWNCIETEPYKRAKEANIKQILTGLEPGRSRKPTHCWDFYFHKPYALGPWPLTQLHYTWTFDWSNNYELADLKLVNAGLQDVYLKFTQPGSHNGDPTLNRVARQARTGQGHDLSTHPSWPQHPSPDVVRKFFIKSESSA